MDRFISDCLDREISQLNRNYERGIATDRPITLEEQSKIVQRWQYVSSERLQSVLSMKHPEVAWPRLKNVRLDGRVVFEDIKGLSVDHVTSLGYQMVSEIDKYVPVPLPPQQVKNWVLVNRVEDLKSQ